MTTQFRAYAEDELPNLEFRTTGEEALIDAISRISSERPLDGHQPTIIVEEVREATLSDFFDFSQLVSLMRESMQEKIGNDDALSDPTAVAALAGDVSEMIGENLNDAAHNTKLRIDGYVVISRKHAERWWIKAGEDE